MRIAEVRINKVVVRMRPDTVHSPNIQDTLCAQDAFSGRRIDFDAFPKWVIELVADDGTVGLGEALRGDLYEPLKRMADMIVGKTTTELPLGRLPLPYDAMQRSYIIYEPFEMAWLDLVGKHLGVPVWHLLGGKQIDRVPVDYFMGRADPDETGRRTQLADDMGFEHIYMKCALGDPITERVKAVRQIKPDCLISLDPNERFENPAETVAISRALDGLGPIAFESPVPQHRLDWYVMLRSKVPQPIRLHLACMDELLAALRVDAADEYNLLGPLKEFTDWAGLATAAGCKTLRGTGLDLGIRDMSSVHCAAAAGCTLPSQIYGNFMREDDLIIDPIQYDHGCAVVPDAPGLGVELDRDAVEKYRVPIEEEQQ